MIDRSKPLPIHEFPSLVNEVARLKEHVAEVPALTRDAQYLLYPDGDAAAECYSDLGGSEDWLTGRDLAKTLCELLNVATKLLDVLGMIRAGDVEILESMLSGFSGQEYGDDGPGTEYLTVNDLLRRYRDMANRMEANR